MDTDTTPMSAMAYTTSGSATKKAKRAEVKNQTAEVNPGTVESTPEMLIKPFEELSNPEGYLLFSPF